MLISSGIDIKVAFLPSSYHVYLSARIITNSDIHVYEHIALRNSET
jgi:hypothetical protein